MGAVGRGLEQLALLMLTAMGAAAQNSAAVDAVGFVEEWGGVRQMFQWNGTGWTSVLDSLPSGPRVWWTDPDGEERVLTLHAPRVHTDPRSTIIYRGARADGPWPDPEPITAPALDGYWVSVVEGHAPFLPTHEQLPENVLASVGEAHGLTDLGEHMELVSATWRATLAGQSVLFFRVTRQDRRNRDYGCMGQGELFGLRSAEGQVQVLRSLRQSVWCELTPQALLVRNGRLYLFVDDTDSHGDTPGLLYEQVESEFVPICREIKPERCS